MYVNRRQIEVCFNPDVNRRGLLDSKYQPAHLCLDDSGLCVSPERGLGGSLGVDFQDSVGQSYTNRNADREQRLNGIGVSCCLGFLPAMTARGSVLNVNYLLCPIGLSYSSKHVSEEVFSMVLWLA